MTGADARLYVHLGEDVVIRVQDVVAIVDLAAMQRRGLSIEQVLGRASHEGVVTWVGNGAGTSLVVTRDRIYVSPISPTTLRRRAGVPWAADPAGGPVAVVTGRTRRKAARRRRRGF